MTHMSWNLGGINPASKDVRRIASLWLLSLSLLACTARIQAADQPLRPFHFRSAPRLGNDLEIETKARRALRSDAQLRPLNLNVHVVDDIARLAGPVPSPPLKQRAIAIVEHVAGVLKVTADDLYISSAAQVPKQMSVLIQDDQPTQTRSASPHSLSSGTVPLAQTAVAPPVGPERPEAVVGGEPVTLLAPEIAPRPRRVPDPGRLTANPRPASPLVSFADSLEQTRQRDSRFRALRTQIQGTTVYIFPGDAPVEDAMMFAQAIRRLPGVQYVVVTPGSR